jgi:hypothetical protein
LPPVRVAEHKKVPEHDQFESGDDGFGGQSNWSPEMMALVGSPMMSSWLRMKKGI